MKNHNINLSIVVVLILISCRTNSDFTENDVSVNFQVIRNNDFFWDKSDSLCLKLVLHNNTNTPFYIVGLTDYIDVGDILPLHENFGSYANFVDNKKEIMKSLNQKEYKNRRFDTLKVNFPFFQQSTIKNNEIDTTLANRWFDLMERYESLLFNSLENEIPKPEEGLNLTELSQVEISFAKAVSKLKFLTQDERQKLSNQVILLEPLQKKIIIYDLTPLALDTVIYQITFKPVPPPFFDKLKNIGNYKKFDEDSLLKKRFYILPYQNYINKN